MPISAPLSQSFLHAVRSGDLATVRNVIQDGVVDIDQQDEDGNSALMIAAEQGCLEVVRVLIDAHAEVHFEAEGKTAFSLACQNISKNHEIAVLLLAHGANADVLEVAEQKELLIKLFTDTTSSRHLALWSAAYLLGHFGKPPEFNSLLFESGYTIVPLLQIYGMADFCALKKRDEQHLSPNLLPDVAQRARNWEIIGRYARIGICFKDFLVELEKLYQGGDVSVDSLLELGLYVATGQTDGHELLKTWFTSSVNTQQRNQSQEHVLPIDRLKDDFLLLHLDSSTKEKILAVVGILQQPLATPRSQFWPIAWFNGERHREACTIC